MSNLLRASCINRSKVYCVRVCCCFSDALYNAFQPAKAISLVLSSEKIQQITLKGQREKIRTC